MPDMQPDQDEQADREWEAWFDHDVDDKFSRASRDPDDPIFDYDDEDLEGSRFDPDCEDDPM